MSKVKQIEEMTRTIRGDSCLLKCDSCDKCGAWHVSVHLYEAGYRKQSEGEWIYHECVSSYDGAKSGYSCSKCSAFVDEEVFDTDEFHKKHCGNCGAKMKGGTE
jgi:hypothetical protein